MKDKVICIIFSMLLFSTIISATGSINVTKGIQNPVGADEWPMFRYNSEHTGYSAATAPVTNNTKWCYQTEGPIRSSPAVVDNKLYISSYDWNLYCLDASNGEKLWSYRLNQEWLRSSPAVADGRVYVGGYNNEYFDLVACLICLNAENGSLLWEHFIEGDIDIWSSPTIYEGKVYMTIIGQYEWGYGGRVYCLDAITGNPIWNYNVTDGIIESSPAVANGRVYIGVIEHMGDGRVLCLDAENGSEIWAYTTDGYIKSSPAVYNDNVYIGSMKDGERYGIVYCLNAENGDFVWSYTTGDYVKSSPAVHDDKVYIGSEDANVYCLDAKTGDEIWIFSTYGGVDSSPAVADGKVYVGSWDGYVYCLDAEIGDEIWSYAGVSAFPPPVRSSPAVVNGCVYIGTYYGTVIAFEDTLEIGEIKGGIGVSAEISNIGDKDIVSIDWTISIAGSGLLRKINISWQEILPPLESSCSTIIKMPALGFGKVNITVAANPRGVTPITKTADGLLIGCFVIILGGE